MAHNSNNFDSRSHSSLLSASLQNLQLNLKHGVNDEPVINEFLPNLKENIDSYKPAAEQSTKPLSRPNSGGTESPIPDPNGLGWPGASVFVCGYREPSFISPS